MIRTLERTQPESEISEMVSRVMNFNDLIKIDSEWAKSYWGFVLKSYIERGYESHEVFEIMCAADETIAQFNKEIEGINNGR